MLQSFTVSFFGHRFIDRFFETEDKVNEILHRLIRKNEYVEVLIGRDGEFDQLVSSAVRQAKRRYGEDRCCLTWVMPYPKAEYAQNEKSFDEYYDSVEVCDASADAHPKAAIQIRNESMVDRSDLVIVYVEHSNGGAYQTMKYAIKAGKKMLNLADDEQALDTF